MAGQGPVKSVDASPSRNSEGGYSPMTGGILLVLQKFCREISEFVTVFLSTHDLFDQLAVKRGSQQFDEAVYIAAQISALL